MPPSSTSRKQAKQPVAAMKRHRATEPSGSSSKGDSGGSSTGLLMTALFSVAVALLISNGWLDLASHKLAAYLTTHFLYVRTCTPDQPLVIRTESFLPQEQFQNISECLASHPLVVDDQLGGGGFSTTRGFVVKLNREGLQEFRADDRLACLVEYFDAARAEDANAWVMNLLICDSKQYNRSQVAVGLHLDQTLAIDSALIHLAHQVNVLYTSVPADMEGGELEIWSNHTEKALEGDDSEALLNSIPPEAKITPQENTMVEFRGDSWHQVRGYEAPQGGLRISLVLEQYMKSDTDYALTHRFELKMKTDMEML